MATAPDSLRRARPLLGTFVEIVVPRPAGRELPGTDAAIAAAFAAVEKVHRLMSFHDPASDVSRLNREAAARPVTVDAWTHHVLGAAANLHRRSSGLFDVAVAPVLQRLGLLPDADGRAAASQVPPLDAVELLSGHRVRFRHPRLRIDLGGIAKGFAVDRAVEALRDSGLTGGLVNAGGDLAAFGPAPHAVYLRDPGDPRHALGPVAIIDEALATSGGRFDPFGSATVIDPAVIDPRTRQPAHAAAGATVRAPSCLVADALTKVVMIAGEAASGLLDHFHASALLVQQNGDVRVTPAWQDSRAA
jgi:FAD:protein FMN transferase